MNKKSQEELKKINEELSKQIFEQLEIKEEDILEVKDGVVQLDFNNPKHLEVYKRWIED